MNYTEEAIIVQKTPDGHWDQTIDWGCPSRQLGDDLIDVSTWAVSGADSALTLSDETISADKKETTVWLTGGTLGVFYQVTNTITTEDGRIFTGTFVVSVVPYVYLVQPRTI